MYGRVLNAVPTKWLVNGLTAYNMVIAIIGGSIERIWSFICTVACNLTGLDIWYVLQDDSPAVIPYTAYKWGGLAERIWYYNKRTREFRLGRIKSATQPVNLPALSLELINKNSEGERNIYIMSDWLSTITIKSHANIYPTPMQLISCWSLHSGIWPSFNSGINRVRMISGSDGNIYTASAAVNPSIFSWASFENGEEVADQPESESESESEESESSAEESESEPESESESKDTENSKSECVSDEEVEYESSSEDTENSKSEQVEKDAASEQVEEAEKAELQHEITKLRDETSNAIEKLKWHLALAAAVDEKPVLVDYKSGVVDMEEVD